MPRPENSVRSVLFVVFAVATDSMAFRSIHGRPLSGMGVLELTLLGALPMANLLAVAAALLLWRRGKPVPFRLGFLIGGAVAIAVTVYGARPGLDWLEASLESTAFGDRLRAAPTLAWMFTYLVLPGLVLLCQLATALVVGRLARWIATSSGPEILACDVAPRRRRFAEALTMMLLLAAPAVLVEGIQRWSTDPTWARMQAGDTAVVDIRVMNGCRVTIEDGSTFLLTNGTEVQVDDDSQPPTLAGVMAMGGKEQQFGDHRSVRITLRDGEHAGERTSLPRQFLRAVQ